MRRLRFAEFIRRQVKRHGWEGFADRVGVTPSTLTRLSGGSLPSIKTLRQVCIAGGMSPTLFIEEFRSRMLRG